MGLDLRLPLGLMFLSIGLIILGYGLLTMHSEVYEKSLGLNVNIGWGLAMVLFGGTMFLLARLARGKERANEVSLHGNNRTRMH